MKSSILSGIILTLFLLITCAIIYPLMVVGIAQLTPDKGKGEKVFDQKGNIYYANIGQKFDKDIYFFSRPSAVDYNASKSGGSNKAPTNPEYLSQVKERVEIFKMKNHTSYVPVEMVTASGSGLDPDISLEAANVQTNRIAKARGLDTLKIHQLIQNHLEKSLFGPEKINVLKLNIDLDHLK